MTSYNVMGRAAGQTNPTEMTSSWVSAGDDAAGWRWSYQQYDWSGRPTITTNTDGTTREVSYSGCGCAGGEVITMSGKAVAQGRRRQKVYKDLFGRQLKTELLNWDGSVYSTTKNEYNVRDQIKTITEYQGADTSAVYQTTSMTYDGHGRLASRKSPAASAPTNYTYFADDMIQSATDARGASATFAYNSRHLITGVTYYVPSGVGETPNVSYTYDAAGNRTQMTDGAGYVNYTYNTLGLLQSETRQFTGVGQYTLSYDYTIAGQLKSITDPFNDRIDYAFDQAGRLSGISGTPFGGVTQPDVPSELDKLLKGDCGKFVKKLIEKLESKDNPARSKDPRALLKDITIELKDQGKTKSGKPVAGRAYPGDAQGKGKLGITPVIRRPNVEYNMDAVNYKYVESILHELIHFAGQNERYTDREAAIAAVAAAGGKLPKDYKEWFDGLDPDDRDANSEFFDAVLQIFCPSQKDDKK